MKKQDLINVSVSSRSYILSYYPILLVCLVMNLMFPSPLGVIFSLIFKLATSESSKFSLFPSPLGVIFSLIEGTTQLIGMEKDESFRLLSELYSLL